MLQILAMFYTVSLMFVIWGFVGHKVLTFFGRYKSDAGNQMSIVEMAFWPLTALRSSK